MSKKKSKEEKKRVIITCKACSNGLAELVCRHGRPRLCLWHFNREDHDFREALDAGSFEYVPFDPTKYVESGHMFLPEGPTDYDSEDRLSKDIYSFLCRYSDYPDEFRRFDVWYCKFTWIYDRYPALAYRRALGSLYGVGKTRWATVLGSICYRGFFQGAATTAAPVFRLSDMIRGTQIIDENIYTQKTEVGQAIILILNSGYSKATGLVTRCVGRSFIPTPFLTYSPKLIAARQRFPDPATESRTITHKAYKTNRKDIPVHLEKDFWKESLELRNKLLMWRFRRYNQPIKWDEEFKALDIEPRLKEVLLPIAANIPEQKDREWFKQLTEDMNLRLVEERSYTTEAVILDAIFDLMNAQKHLSMKNIANRITESDPSEKHIATPKRVGYLLREKLNLRTRREYDNETKTNPYTLVRNRDNLERLWLLAESYGLRDKAQTITSITSITKNKPKYEEETRNFGSLNVSQVIEVIAKWLDNVSQHGREPVSSELLKSQLNKLCGEDRAKMKEVWNDLQKRKRVKYDKGTKTIIFHPKTKLDKIFDQYETE